MERAIIQARIAANNGEVPVGALIVDRRGDILAECGNNCIGRADPTGHAEIRALRVAAKKEQNYRLPGASVYVTLEPCAMCAAAMVNARISRLIYGATDPKTGAIASVYNIGIDGLLNHRLTVTSGVLADQCGQLLKDFFRSRR